MVLDGLLVERNVAAEVDDGGDGPAPFFVRHAHHQCVIDGGMGLENFLNFLGVNLLASCIDAHAATAQQSQAAIGLDLAPVARNRIAARSEEHTSELQSLMRNSYAVFCLKKKQKQHNHYITHVISTQYIQLV